MLARRFLIAVAVVTLLFVAGAFLIYQFGSSVLLRSATPSGEFEAPPPHDGPDYRSGDSWLARPGLESSRSPAAWRPEGYRQTMTRPKAAAAFYIHPTTYLQRDRWNAPLRGSGESDARADLFVRTQASAFADRSEIWAPRYRQAAYGAFLLKSDDAHKALDLAYSDVTRAFEQFLREIPDDRPIILAGHSQGALHLTRLLTAYGAQLRDRLVAAYVVGWPLSTAADLPAMGLPPCRTPEQTGCVLSWQSFGEPANPKLVLDAWEETRGPTGKARRRDDLLCVNPVTGSVNGAAPPAANPGTLVPSADLQTAIVEAGLVGARCSDGLLLIDGAIPPLGPFVLPGNNYHVYDYALFWGAIARDASRRSEAWLRR